MVRSHLDVFQYNHVISEYHLRFLVPFTLCPNFYTVILSADDNRFLMVLSLMDWTHWCFSISGLFSWHPMCMSVAVSFQPTSLSTHAHTVVISPMFSSVVLYDPVLRLIHSHTLLTELGCLFIPSFCQSDNIKQFWVDHLFLFPITLILFCILLTLLTYNDLIKPPYHAS